MGRIPYLETPQNALQLIRPRHREIMRRLVCGQKQREIALEMNLNEGRLSIIINSPLFKAELKKMERDVRTKAVAAIGDVTTRVAKLQGPAIDVLETIVKDKGKIPYSLKRAAAMDILELAGTKKGHANEEGMNDFAQFISEAFAEAKERAFSRLNNQLEAECGVPESQSDSPHVIDVAGHALPLDEAEDVALASFQLELDEKGGKEDEGAGAPPADDSSTSENSAATASAPSSSTGNTNGSGNGTNGNGSESGDTLMQLLETVMHKEGLSADQIQKLLDS